MDSWKTGEISAIIKKDVEDRQETIDQWAWWVLYGRFMESLIREEITQHMRGNKLFSTFQYEFIDRR